jgi:hypothetical protein
MYRCRAELEALEVCCACTTATRMLVLALLLMQLFGCCKSNYSTADPNNQQRTSLSMDAMHIKHVFLHMATAHKTREHLIPQLAT